MDLEAMLRQLDECSNQLDDFVMNQFKNGVSSEAVAATLVNLGMQIYKTVLDDVSYERMIDLIYASRSMVKPLYDIKKAEEVDPFGDIDTSSMN